MEKYKNGRVMNREGGRFAKRPTLEKQGYDISNGAEKVCAACGEKSRPIINTGWICWEGGCGHRN